MVAHPLTGAWLKVARAREHLDALQAELAGLVIHPYRIVGQYEDETPEGRGHIVFRFEVRTDIGRIPRRLGVIAADAIHNLRSALDLLAWQLAIAGTGPGPRTQFPIFEDADDYQRHEEALLKGIAVGDRAAIERLQPYHIKADRLAGRAVPGSELSAMLMIVGRLDNVDKHSLLLPTVAVAMFQRPTFSNLRRAELRPAGSWIAVEDGAVFCELVDVIPLDPHREVQVDAQPPVTVVFGDPTSVQQPELWADRRRGALSVADLFAAADAIDTIIRRFVPSFERRGADADEAHR